MIYDQQLGLERLRALHRSQWFPLPACSPRAASSNTVRRIPLGGKVDAKNMVPGGLILQGPNPYIPARR